MKTVYGFALSMIVATLTPMVSMAVGSPENPNSIRIMGTPDCKAAVQSARAARVLLTGLFQGNNQFDKVQLRALEYDAQILAENIPDYCPRDVKTPLEFSDKLTTAVLKLDPKLQNKAIEALYNQTVKTTDALQGPNRMQE